MVAFTALKGGVGKSTSAINFSAGLARYGSVRALDLDRASHTLSLFKGRIDGVDVQATTSGRLAGILRRGGSDFLVADCPPSLAKETGAALRVAQLVVIPVVPEMFSVHPLLDFFRVLDRARQINPQLQALFLLSMCDQRDKDAAGIERRIRHEMGTRPGINIWDESVPRSTTISAANNRIVSVLDHAPRSAVAGIYRRVTDHVVTSCAAKAAATI